MDRIVAQQPPPVRPSSEGTMERTAYTPDGLFPIAVLLALKRKPVAVGYLEGRDLHLPP